MKAWVTFLCLLWIIASNQTVYAQSVSDSLEQELDTSSPDSMRVSILFELHKAYISIDTGRSIEYLNRGLVLSKELFLKQNEVQFYLALCNYSWKRGQSRRAQSALDAASAQLEMLDLPKLTATFYMEQGILHYRGGTYQLAAEAFLLAHQNFAAVSDTLGMAKCLLNMGASYWEMEDHDQALVNYKKAQELQERVHDEISRARTLGNIGLLFRSRGDYDSALLYYQQSLEINQKNDFARDEVIDLQNIGSLYSFQNKLPQAFEYFAAAAALATKIDDAHGLLYAEHGRASVYTQMGRYDLAIPELHRALDLADELGVNEEVKNLNQSLADAYEKTGEFEKALAFNKSYQLWKDSLASMSILSRIRELELKYETSEKDKAIALLGKDNEIQRAISSRQSVVQKGLIGTIAGSVLIGLLAVFMLRQRMLNQRVVNEKDKAIKASEYREQVSHFELKALKAQMNPHFIFNCLNSINNMILSGERKSASRFLGKFSGVIRNVLDTSETQWVGLRQELTALESYLKLECLRFGDRVSYELKTAMSMETELLQVPPMLIQPIVENAIIHGLIHKNEVGKVLISLSEKNGFVECVVEDDGIGLEASKTINADRNMDYHSFGISLITKRLQLLNGRLNEDTFSINTLYDGNGNAVGTRVILLIPTFENHAPAFGYN